MENTSQGLGFRDMLPSTMESQLETTWKMKWKLGLCHGLGLRPCLEGQETWSHVGYLYPN